MVTFDDLPQALSWLDAHIDFESAMPSRRSLPTLDRMRALTDLLGDPQQAYPAVHITGTNGKGSTAAMTTALLGRPGPDRRHLHQPEPDPGQRADLPQRRTHRRRGLRRRPRVAGPPRAADGRTPHPVRAPHRGRLGLVRRRGGRRGRDRGGIGRPVGLHQRRRRRRRRPHQHQLRPHRGPRPHAGGHRARQVGHLQAGEPGGHRRVRPHARRPPADGGGRRRGGRGVGPGSGLRLHRQPDRRRGPVDRRPHPGPVLR